MKYVNDKHNGHSSFAIRHFCHMHGEHFNASDEADHHCDNGWAGLFRQLSSTFSASQPVFQFDVFILGHLHHRLGYKFTVSIHFNNSYIRTCLYIIYDNATLDTY